MPAIDKAVASSQERVELLFQLIEVEPGELAAGIAGLHLRHGLAPPHHHGSDCGDFTI